MGNVISVTVNWPLLYKMGSHMVCSVHRPVLFMGAIGGLIMANNTYRRGNPFMLPECHCGRCWKRTAFSTLFLYGSFELFCALAATTPPKFGAGAGASEGGGAASPWGDDDPANGGRTPGLAMPPPELPAGATEERPPVGVKE